MPTTLILDVDTGVETTTRDTLSDDDACVATSVDATAVVRQIVERIRGLVEACA